MTNDTEAPTNENTAVALANKLGLGSLNEDELAFVSLQHQFYGLKGRIMTDKDAREYLFEPDEFAELMGSEKVQIALHERNLISKPALKGSKTPVGTEKGTEHPTWADTALTPHQLLCANVMLDLTDGRSEKKRLQDLGLSTQQYQQWLSEPKFNEYMLARAESLIGNSQFEAHLALVDKVKSGDLGAIKYFNEFTGRFVSQGSGFGTTVNVGVSGTKDDFRALLVNILEIIQDEVEDTNAKLRIAERFKSLMTNQSVASALLGEVEPIEQPHIKQARELTPQLQTLMDKGEGYE